MNDDDENAERRENELLALDSIYGERQFVIATQGEAGKLAAYVELPDNFKVAYPSPRQQDKREPSAAKEEEPPHEEINIEFLPPIILDFEMPLNYPSDVPPSFTLSCKWLNVIQLSELCVQLDRLWDEQGGGCEVLFEWMQFLTEDALTFLCITSPLRLSRLSQRYLRQSSNSKASVDKRACQDIASLDDLVNFLTTFDAQESVRHFNTAYFSCQICYLEKLGTECVRFPTCKHIYCTECVTNYFTIQIRDGSVRSLHCPEDKCDTQADPSLVKKLVPGAVYEQYEKFLLQSTLDCMDDMTYCPRETCQSVVLVDLDAEKLGRCPACKFVFCVFCKRTYHGVTSCPVNSKELRALRDQYLNGSGVEKERLEKIYGKKKLQTAVEEMYTEAWMEKFSQRCPSCRTNIEKIDGCNKMHCLKCDNYFCWLCRTQLARDQPYLHFNDIKSKCFNKLFMGVDEEGGEFDFSDDEDDWW